MQERRLDVREARHQVNDGIGSSLGRRSHVAD